VANTRTPAVLIIVSLVLLFAPGVGDLRWIGLVAFLYVGLPWYILSVKDKIKGKLSGGLYAKQKFRIHSVTLLVFGLLCAVVGVAIDLFILYRVYSDPSVIAVSGVLFRLIIGVPFFGFGAYLIHLALGWVGDET